MLPGTIIIPVYNAPEKTKECIDSVIKNTDLNNECKILIIDDGSNNPKLNEILSSIVHPFIEIDILKHNKGYVKTINYGISLCANRDVLLLNSDTVVTPNWWTKIRTAAYMMENVGTVTPVSNNAGAFSVPNYGNNTLHNFISLDQMSMIVEECGAGNYLIAPTGNGFCMYIRRDLINKIGVFDDINFPIGYGEENDFCMRAIEHSFINIVALDTYIFHYEHASFQNTSSALCRQGIQRLRYLYPEYEQKCSVFTRNPKLLKVRHCVAENLKSLETNHFQVQVKDTLNTIKTIFYAGSALFRKIRYIFISEGVRSLINKIFKHFNKLATSEGRVALQTILSQPDGSHCELPSFFSVVNNIRKLIRGYTKFYCVIDNNWGGGAQSYIVKKIQEYVDQESCVVYISIDKKLDSYIIIIYVHKKKIIFKSNSFDDIFYCSLFKFNTIIVNELIAFSLEKGTKNIDVDIMPQILKKILQVASINMSRIIVPIHDYFCICPSYTLTTPENKFCGLPAHDSAACKKCLVRHKFIGANIKTIHMWREAWGNFLNQSTEIICFSESSVNLVKMVYPKAQDNIVLQPHKALYEFKSIYIPKESRVMTIGVIGNIDKHKGSEIVRDLQNLLQERERIVIIGQCFLPVKNIRSKKIIFTGPYQREDLPRIFKEYNINIGFIPSVWPETFNYVTQECMQLGLPLVSFNIGAHGDKIRKWNKGRVATEISAESAYSTLKGLFMETYGDSE